MGLGAHLFATALFALTGACSFIVDGDAFRYDGSIVERDAGDPNRDSGAPDAGDVDGGQLDGGDRDGGVIDGGDRDAGDRDGGERDAGFERDSGIHRDAGPRDGGRDGGQIDGGVELLTVEPADLEEGMGTAVPVPIVISGAALPVNAVVTQVAAHPIDLGTPVVGADMIAIPVGVPVDAVWGQGDNDREVVLQVRDGANGPVFGVAHLTLTALDELTISTSGPEAASDLNGRYAEVVIPSGVELTVTGDQNSPLDLTATGRMQIAGTIRIDGANGQASAGGCGAGGSNGNGGCGAQGGRSGGGGGGNATAGATGGAGNGGQATSGAWLFPLSSARGNGGGGGAFAVTAGSRGGGGGGVVALTSLGALEIAGMTISVRGEAGVGGGCGVVDGGPGGGGSGGSILVRGRELVGATNFAFDVTGGAGGVAGGCPGNNGGAGARGRTRLDIPVGNPQISIAPEETNTHDRRGPAFLTTDVIFTGSTVTVSMLAQNGFDYPMSIDTISPGSATPINGTAQYTFNNVMPGLHTVCAAAPGGLGNDKGETCIDIAVVP
ncbi:MAG: hypothetical protein RMA76_22290 [Deltaproteobacteria bacterium]